MSGLLITDDVNSGEYINVGVEASTGAPKGRLIIVEDDRDQARELRDYLSEAGFTIAHASDALAFRALWQTGVPDAILLDLNLPGESGTSIVKFVRRSSSIPILIVSGRSDPVERIVGLELGADDYIVKPFHPRELLARIAAVLRRTQPVTKGDHEATLSGDAFRFDGFVLVPAQRRLFAPDGTELSLTSAMFRLMEVLVQRPGKTITRDQLSYFVYGRAWQSEDRAIDNLVLRLRKSISEGRLIKSVRGAGYVLAANVEVVPMSELSKG